MIFGTGIDIVGVERIADKVEHNRQLLEKVFSSREIEMCMRNANPWESFAARFAAKEAFLKATGRGLTLGHNLRDVEVLNDESGKPYLELKGDFLEFSASNKFTKFHVSLSHIKSTACAVVIIES